MEKKQRINAFVQSGLFIKRHFDEKTRFEAENGLHEGLNHLIDIAYTYNGWFIRKFVEESLLNLADLLERSSVEGFVAGILEPIHPKKVAIIMAGNIPFVGYHDLMCVLLSGHKALIKMSSDDNILIPFLMKLLEYFEPGMESMMQFSEGKLTEFDAVIATGSNNTSRHFEYYFGKYPHIIRKNRCSIAVITGKESESELKALGKDIFLYFGLGCRNVSKLMIPEGYKLDTFFEAMFDYKFVIENKKYGNNYDYNRTIYLLNSEKFLDNNFLILKPDNGLFSPVSVVYTQEYKNTQELHEFISENKNHLQCIVGNGEGYTPFGYSQKPVITDYADGVNTLDFLVNL